MSRAASPNRASAETAPANGRSAEEQAARWIRLAELFRPLPVRPEQLAAFAKTPGADEEPWDEIGRAHV